MQGTCTKCWTLISQKWTPLSQIRLTRHAQRCPWRTCCAGSWCASIIHRKLVAEEEIFDSAFVDQASSERLPVVQPRAPFVRDLSVHLMEGWEALAKDTMTSALSACWAIQRLDLSVVGRYILQALSPHFTLHPVPDRCSELCPNRPAAPGSIPG